MLSILQNIGDQTIELCIVILEQNFKGIPSYTFLVLKS